MKYLIIALIVILCLVGVCFGVGGFVFFTACGKHKQIHWLDEAEISRTAYGQFYPHVKASYEWLCSNHAQDHYTESFDGIRLHATWVPAENPRGTIVMVHGYHSCIYTDYGLAMQIYHDLGMNLLMPDHRGHGKSGGTYTTFGVKECRDILSWIAYHNKNLGAYDMILSGLSMGASTVMFLADEDLPQNVKYCIADCGFTSPKEIISKVFTDVMHIPAWPVLWATDLFARFFAGFSLEEKNSARSLKNAKVPFYFIHGLDDDFVPCDMTRRSFDACGSEKQLLLVEGAGHGVSYLHAKEEYHKRNMLYFERYFP